MKILTNLGRYVLFLQDMMVRRERFRVYVNLFFEECIKVGNHSVFITVMVSAFLGAVITLQTAVNLDASYIQDFVVSLVLRKMTILGVGPTVISLVLAGKVGSRTAGEIGTMRITEQIDALEVMGVNATSYLVLPKILASTIMYPILVILAIVLSLMGGWLIAETTPLISPEDFIYGLRLDFVELNIFYALTKAAIFGFLISLISSYQGYFIKGGALEVGQAGTKAVTQSCIAVLLGDYAITQLFTHFWGYSG